LIELLVVVAIIGVLIALLLPAVQAAREAARVAQCRNHLKQLVLGCLAHENATGRFPTGGWGLATGDPDLGTDHHQPGPWLYNILPYIEQRALHDMGAGLGFLGRTPTPYLPFQVPPAKFAANTQRLGVPVAVFYCPTRRPAAAYPPSVYIGLQENNYIIPALVGKTDYAANSGVVVEAFGTGGPICPQSEIRVRDIKDGTSNTYLAGEKYVRADGYTIGIFEGYSYTPDDMALLTGWAGARATAMLNFLNNSGAYWPFPPMRDVSGMAPITLSPLSPDAFYYPDEGFGSAHPDGLGMGFCDGSVRTISYSIDPMVHAELGTIADGLPIDSSGY
jgi:type II secretory pathway pseudopilin PulG